MSEQQFTTLKDFQDAFVSANRAVSFGANEQPPENGLVVQAGSIWWPRSVDILGDFYRSAADAIAGSNPYTFVVPGNPRPPDWPPFLPWNDSGYTVNGLGSWNICFLDGGVFKPQKGDYVRIPNIVSPSLASTNVYVVLHADLWGDYIDGNGTNISYGGITRTLCHPGDERLPGPPAYTYTGYLVEGGSITETTGAITLSSGCGVLVGKPYTIPNDIGRSGKIYTVLNYTVEF